MLFKKTSYTIGLYSEFLARMYLRFHGYKILNNRYITGKNTNRAEIDIIARRKNTIVFVEVKSRQSIDAAWAAITQKQSARLRRAAETFLMNKNWNGDARFDVIVVCKHKIYWAKNAI
ncbi:MAG: YraN family protein [Alphaproteobacteria bacterium]|nr:YraN family protein [Alphaproteobacteria bacterium]